jgi:hypothetical protein
MEGLMIATIEDGALIASFVALFYWVTSKPADRNQTAPSDNSPSPSDTAPVRTNVRTTSDHKLTIG